MKVIAPESAINALKEIIAENQDKPNSVRVYFAGFACSGPNFALARYIFTFYFVIKS